MLHLSCSVYDDICTSNDYSIFDDLDSFEGFDQLKDRAEDKEVAVPDSQPAALLPAHVHAAPDRFIVEGNIKKNVKKEKGGRKKGQKVNCSVCKEQGHNKSTCQDPRIQWARAVAYRPKRDEPTPAPIPSAVQLAAAGIYLSKATL